MKKEIWKHALGRGQREFGGTTQSVRAHSAWPSILLDAAEALMYRGSGKGLPGANISFFLVSRWSAAVHEGRGTKTVHSCIIS